MHDSHVVAKLHGVVLLGLKIKLHCFEVIIYIFMVAIGIKFLPNISSYVTYYILAVQHTDYICELVYTIE